MKHPARRVLAAALALGCAPAAFAQNTPFAAQGAQPSSPSAEAQSPVRRTNPFRALSLAVSPVNDDPWSNTSSQPPPSSQYSGPLFQLSHSYPTTKPKPPVNPPWIQALGGKPIGPSNALAYTQALKEQITPNMRKLLFDYANWNAEKAGWYNQPWLANIREPIHGMYQGSMFPASTFADSGLKKDMITYVVTYYDSAAAYTVGQLWGSSAKDPKVANGQFQEGAIIVKLAMTTATAQDWPVMKDAAQLPLYIPAPPTNYGEGPQQVLNTSLMQVDIIVKDSKTAPKSTWVFTTLVYDEKAPGKDAWDKMVPLGAMWGNDPQSTDTTIAVKETVLNPAAPAYSTATIGWNGRLSGPNDGAVTSGYVNGVVVQQMSASSCMSCHGVAQWPMKDFLLPMEASVKPGRYTPSPAVLLNQPVVFTPGTKRFMDWFQDRPGNVPQNPGTTAVDYDMVFAFKSLPAWAQWKAKQPKAPAQAVQAQQPQQEAASSGRVTYNGL